MTHERARPRENVRYSASPAESHLTGNGRTMRHHFLIRDEGYSYDIPESLSEQIKVLEKEFERVFRRPMQDSDPLFFPFTLLTSPEDTDESLAELMRQGQVNPALRYATEKTGRLLRADKWNDYPTEIRNEWEAAIHEYEQLAASGFPPGPKSPLEELAELLNEELWRLPFVIGLLLRSAYDSHQGQPLATQCCFFYLAKTLKSLQAGAALLDLQYGEDALVLARALFENYLHIVFALRRPPQHDEQVRATVGLMAGTHRHPIRPNGKPDQRRVEDIATGVVCEPLTRRAIAALSPFDEDQILYDVLYDYLSSHAHPDVRTMGRYLADEGFSAAGRKTVDEAFLFLHLLAALNLDAFIKLEGLSRLAKRDGLVLLRHIKRRAKPALEELHRVSPNAMADAIRKRLARISGCW